MAVADHRRLRARLPARRLGHAARRLPAAGRGKSRDARRPVRRLVAHRPALRLRRATSTRGPRPRVDGYDAMASAASNLGPTNATLVVDGRRRVSRRLRATDGAKRGAVPGRPGHCVGLAGSTPTSRPDVGVPAGRARRTRARAVCRARVSRRSSPSTSRGRQLGFLGEPRVNVLELNLALDALSSK